MRASVVVFEVDKNVGGFGGEKERGEGCMCYCVNAVIFPF